MAAVDIDSIPVGIDLQVVDGHVVDSRSQNAEVTALQNGEIAQQDVVAILEGDSLISHAWRLRPWLLRTAAA